MQRDVRFAPVLAQLQAAGFVANVSAPGEREPKPGLHNADCLQATFRAVLRSSHRGAAEYLADALAPFSADNTSYVSQEDDMNRVVWNSVQATRESAYWMEAFGAAAAQHYPKVLQS